MPAKPALASVRALIGRIPERDPKRSSEDSFEPAERRCGKKLGKAHFPRDCRDEGAPSRSKQEVGDHAEAEFMLAQDVTHPPSVCSCPGNELGASVGSIMAFVMRVQIGIIPSESALRERAEHQVLSLRRLPWR